MAGDALEPDDGSYPHFPRRPSTGEPLWSDSAETDGVQVEGITPMPRGLRPGPGGITIDVTPRGPGGVAINPPTLA